MTLDATTSMDAPPAVEMLGIVKRFPGVLANDQVDLEVAVGQIHALLGENGAGKSTLMNVLAGIYRPDAGDIRIHGRRVDIGSPRDATRRGIGMVHQHFMLVPSQTVAENVILGLDKPKFHLNLTSVEARVQSLSSRYGLAVDPGAYVWQLSVGEQQRVEILKLLYRGADILILDEPTAVLTPQEADELGRTLRQLVSEGKTVTFITHKLDEVMAFSDQVTVLRRGKRVTSSPTSLTSKRELARQMVGREVVFRVDRSEYEHGVAEAERLHQAGPVLELRNLTVLGDKGLIALRDVSFTVHEGEILGVAGVAGNGQRELAEAITGLRPVAKGAIHLRGLDVTNRAPRSSIDLGLSHIPEDRLHTGLVVNMSVSDNLVLKAYRRPPLARWGFLRRRPIVRFSERLIREFEIATPGPTTLVKALSGGNQQRALLAREITAGGDAMVAVHPTRGLDIGATEWVQRKLLEQRQKGSAILLISEDLDELMAVSDRIAVLYEGRVMGIVLAADADIEEVGLMMAGTRELDRSGASVSLAVQAQASGEGAETCG